MNHKHPMQPIVKNATGTRFRRNKIVRYLLDAGPHDLNGLSRLGDLFDEEDWCQFAQLIGYSVSGFGDLSYADAECVSKADDAALEQGEVNGE